MIDYANKKDYVAAQNPRPLLTNAYLQTFRTPHGRTAMQIAHVSALCLHSMSVLEPGVSVIRSSLRRISWDCVPSGGTKSDVEGLNTSDRYDRKPVLVRALLPERVSRDEAEALLLGDISCDEAEALLLGYISRNEVEVLPLENEARLVRCCLLLAIVVRERFLRWSAERHTAFKL